MWLARQLWLKARTGQWNEMFSTVAFSAHERYCEWRLGIDTSGFLSVEELGMTNDLFHAYQPTDYRTLDFIFPRLPIHAGKDVLLDLGAGKGRVVIVAAMLPFRSVLGVEISPQLAAVAAANLQRALPKLVCQDVRILENDATTFPIPDEVTVVYLSNPFRGEVLVQVLGNIGASLARRDRPLRILFLHPYDFAIESHRDRYRWLNKLAELSPPGELRVAIYGNAAAIAQIRTGRPGSAVAENNLPPRPR